MEEIFENKTFPLFPAKCCFCPLQRLMTMCRAILGRGVSHTSWGAIPKSREMDTDPVSGAYQIIVLYHTKSCASATENFLNSGQIRLQKTLCIFGPKSKVVLNTWMLILLLLSFLFAFAAKYKLCWKFWKLFSLGVERLLWVDACFDYGWPGFYTQHPILSLEPARAQGRSKPGAMLVWSKINQKISSYWFC